MALLGAAGAAIAPSIRGFRRSQKVNTAKPCANEVTNINVHNGLVKLTSGQLRNLGSSKCPNEDACLPIGHLALFILGVVEKMDLRAFEDEYVGSRSKPYAPETLLSLFIYDYTSRTFMSRKIEAVTYDLIVFRFLAGNTHLDHSTFWFYQFSMRGLTVVENEWNMVCLSLNLKRMAVLRLK